MIHAIRQNNSFKHFIEISTVYKNILGLFIGMAVEFEGFFFLNKLIPICLAYIGSIISCTVLGNVD